MVIFIEMYDGIEEWLILFKRVKEGCIEEVIISWVLKDR